jgi:hypothetical protein
MEAHNCLPRIIIQYDPHNRFPWIIIQYGIFILVQYKHIEIPKKKVFPSINNSQQEREPPKTDSPSLSKRVYCVKTDKSY